MNPAGQRPTASPQPRGRDMTQPKQPAPRWRAGTGSTRGASDGRASSLAQTRVIGERIDGLIIMAELTADPIRRGDLRERAACLCDERSRARRWACGRVTT